MTSTDTLTLAERVEAAEASLEAVVLREAFEAIHGPKPARVHGGSAELTEWLHRFNPFYRMLDAGAFLDAAMSLVPEGYNRLTDNTNGVEVVELFSQEECVTPIQRGSHPTSLALALCAAALRAHAERKG